MLMGRKTLGLMVMFAALSVAGTMTDRTVAQGQSAGASGGTKTATPAYSPQSQNVAIGEVDVKRLVFLMDTDKNGKISKQEFMSFMEAEFERLDTDKSGELDVKELAHSQVTPTHQGGGSHR